MPRETNEMLRIWDALSRTDPAHTKTFARAGGFRGTAVKPIYTTQKMTELFGPAGYGWGMGEPTFQVVPGNDGQVAVYCTASLWWAAKADGETDRSINTVYGVGGDMVVVKQSSGLRTDDEAFKKAFTDAVGNAMKHLGMSADVHMGLFDDSKYVNERRREEEADSSASIAGRHAANTAPIADWSPAVEPPEPMSNTAAKQHWKTIADDMFKCTTLAQLKGCWERHYRVYEQLPEGLQQELQTWKDELKDKLMQQADDKTRPSVAPDFDRLEA